MKTRGRRGGSGTRAASRKPAGRGLTVRALTVRALTVRGFQELIERIYFARDSARGAHGTLLWFVEEVGELVRAIRRGERQNLAEEFSDCFAWLVTLASMNGIDLETVARAKYRPRLPALPPHALRL